MLLSGNAAEKFSPAGGIGVRGKPLQARKRYLCAMLAKLLATDRVVFRTLEISLARRETGTRHLDF